MMGDPITSTCGPSSTNGRSNVETTVEAENVPRTRSTSSPMLRSPCGVKACRVRGERPEGGYPSLERGKPTICLLNRIWMSPPRPCRTRSRPDAPRAPAVALGATVITVAILFVVALALIPGPRTSRLEVQSDSSPRACLAHHRSTALRKRVKNDFPGHTSGMWSRPDGGSCAC